MIFYLIKFFIVFIAMVVTDICWATYFIKIEERKAVQAGYWAVLLFFSGAIVTAGYIGDYSLILAAALGAFVGTYITVENKRKKEAKIKTRNKKDNYGC